MSKKAIYFQNEFNPANAPAGTQCITYTKEDGFQFYDDGKITTVTSAVDKTQSNEIYALTERITILETKVAGGVLEDGDTVTVTSASSEINSPEKTVIIFGKEMKNTTTPVSITGKEIIANDITAKSNVVLTGTDSVNVTAASISGNCELYSLNGDINVDTLTLTASGSTRVIMNAEEDLTLTGFTTEGAFNNQTNQINAEYAKAVTIKDTTFNATGYNTIMIAQPTANTQDSVVPSAIVIENVEFKNVTNNAVNIDRTTDNATVLIDNCKFIDCSNPIRFRNYNYAKGIAATVKDCKFDKWDSNIKWSGAVILEDRYSYNEYVKTNPKPTSGDLTEWKAGLVDFAKTAAPFGPEHLTMTFENCTFPANSPEYTSDNITEYIGKESTERFAFIWIPGADVTLEYDEKIYPKIMFK